MTDVLCGMAQLTEGSVAPGLVVLDGFYKAGQAKHKSKPVRKQPFSKESTPVPASRFLLTLEWILKGSSLKRRIKTSKKAQK